jgi:Cu(I)/Ag(I) efflux system protein CusF
MLNFRIALATLTVGFALIGAASAQTAEPSSAPTETAAPASGAQAQPASGAEMTEGEVRKVDRDNKKITIKHGPLKSLDMPGMTMVFGVKDDTVLDKVQPGEKVQFQAEKIDGKFVVTAIESLR